MDPSERRVKVMERRIERAKVRYWRTLYQVLHIVLENLWRVNVRLGVDLGSSLVECRFEGRNTRR